MPTAIGSYATTAAVKTRLGDNGSSNDTLIGTLCDQVNGWIESYTGRPIAPYDATYTFDYSSWTRDGKTLVVPRGVRSVSSFTLSSQTGGTQSAINAADYFLLPRDHERAPGWPAIRIVLSDYVTLSVYDAASAGYGTAVVTGSWGWAAIPDELKAVAETTAVRAFHARQAGQQDIIGSDETGQPIVSRYVSARDRETLDLYRWKPGVW